MTARTPLIAGNWKMHGLRDDAERLARAVVDGCSDLSDREVLLAPPFTALDVVAGAVRGSAIYLGAQNVHWEDHGAYTGEVSTAMLRDVGCSHVIIGHSERRQHFGETDANVARKVRASQASGLVPIVCVGETAAERAAGTTLEVIARQLHDGLLGPETTAIASLVVAYEPVWAIGTGEVATPDLAQAVHAFIREVLAGLFESQAAAGCRILYGGSVKPDNVDELMKEPDIDGVLVGGASLDAKAFLRIVRFA